MPDADLVAAAESFGLNTDYSVGPSTFGGSFRPRPTPPSMPPFHRPGPPSARLRHRGGGGDRRDVGRTGPCRIHPPETTPTDAGATTTSDPAEADQTTTTAGAEGESAAAASPTPRPEPRTPDGTAQTLLGLMRRVVTDGSGQEAAISGVEVAGKTGTAEFGQGDPPPTHAWFIGIRGDNAVAVLIEGGGVGGRVAAPIAGAILAGLPGADPAPSGDGAGVRTGRRP